MNSNHKFHCSLLRLLWLVAAHCVVTDVRADDKVTYDDHLAPIFRQRCGSCHNPTAHKADLDVTNYLGLMQGGASGACIEAGDASASYLFSLVTHEAEPYMPQNADKLPDAEIDLLRRWIDGGALENAGSKAVKPKAKMSVAVRARSGKTAGGRSDAAAHGAGAVLSYWRKPPMARSLATSPWAPLVAVTSQRQVLLYNTTTLELVGVFAVPRRAAQRGPLQPRRAAAAGRRRTAGGERQSRRLGYHDRRARVRSRQRAGRRPGRRHQRRPQADRARRPAAYRTSLLHRDAASCYTRMAKAYRLGARRRIQPGRRAAGHRRPQRRALRVGNAYRQ